MQIRQLMETESVNRNIALMYHDCGFCSPKRECYYPLKTYF